MAPDAHTHQQPCTSPTSANAALGQTCGLTAGLTEHFGLGDSCISHCNWLAPWPSPPSRASAYVGAPSGPPDRGGCSAPARPEPESAPAPKAPAPPRPPAHWPRGHLIGTLPKDTGPRCRRTRVRARHPRLARDRAWPAAPGRPGSCTPEARRPSGGPARPAAPAHGQPGGGGWEEGGRAREQRTHLPAGPPQPRIRWTRPAGQEAGWAGSGTRAGSADWPPRAPPRLRKPRPRAGREAGAARARPIAEAARAELRDPTYVGAARRSGRTGWRRPPPAKFCACAEGRNGDPAALCGAAGGAGAGPRGHVSGGRGHLGSVPGCWPPSPAVCVLACLGGHSLCVRRDLVRLALEGRTTPPVPAARIIVGRPRRAHGLASRQGLPGTAALGTVPALGSESCGSGPCCAGPTRPRSHPPRGPLGSDPGLSAFRPRAGAGPPPGSARALPLPAAGAPASPAPCARPLRPPPAPAPCARPLRPPPAPAPCARPAPHLCRYRPPGKSGHAPYGRAGPQHSLLIGCRAALQLVLGGRRIMTSASLRETTSPLGGDAGAVGGALWTLRVAGGLRASPGEQQPRGRGRGDPEPGRRVGSTEERRRRLVGDPSLSPLASPPPPRAWAGSLPQEELRGWKLLRVLRSCRLDFWGQTTGHERARLTPPGASRQTSGRKSGPQGKTLKIDRGVCLQPPADWVLSAPGPRVCSQTEEKEERRPHGYLGRLGEQGRSGLRPAVPSRRLCPGGSLPSVDTARWPLAGRGAPTEQRGAGRAAGAAWGPGVCRAGFPRPGLPVCRAPAP
ncbi:basic proline-rich protein-like [Diceros bicornis minor]|uniref:basic proline-rich protein-like n=1 Tax=Diceros bicornis minor TaxID=77932 RepID=UPI0026EBB121|nr:basic proline-rich protein-like [Diceros bicornis minor]